jgi:hypothetical protein
VTLLVAVVALVGATGVRGDPGLGSSPPSATEGASPAAADTAPGAGESTPAAQNASDNGQGGSDKEQPKEEQAASESTPAAENAQGGPGASESTPAAENAQGGPGASESTPAAENAQGGPGASESTPAAENGHGGSDKEKPKADQGASVGQAAGAGASAEQGQVGNTQVNVRVDEPGKGAPVGQRNEAEANADASASAGVDTPGSSNVQQDAQAEAGAAQGNVSNTAVTVRVGSPGDDGGVTQTNAASGSASAATDGGGAEASATAAQEDVENTNISVRVFSPGDDGAVSQLNQTAAAADAGGAGTEEARAIQDGVRNTSVSIRVESDGSSGQVSQQSDASALTGGDDGTAVAVSSDAVDTVVTVVVDGSELERPGAGGLVIWEWTWNWDRDESQGLADLSVTVSSWNWDWDGTGAPNGGRGNVTSRAARDDERNRQAGSWEWSWQWSREGVPSWAWQWDWRETMSCSSCVWIWNWSWNWVGVPTQITGAGSSDMPGSTVAGQLNSANASATAVTTAEVTQVAAQEGIGDGTQYVGQLIEIQQDADAVATARQVNVASTRRGTGTLGQFNVVRSAAEAILDASALQDAEQTLRVRDKGVADQWLGQQIDVVQGGYASSDGSQAGVTLDGPGGHDVYTAADASAQADLAQRAFQGGLVEDGSSEQWVGQLAVAEQLVDASSMVIQTGRASSRRTGGIASASSSADDLLIVEQAADQAAVRGGGEGLQAIQQVVFVGQYGSAVATTGQRAGASMVPLASSEAVAVNRAAVTQAASQSAAGISGLDIQEALQQSIVVQIADAVSTSNGGIAGVAAVVNCAITQQDSKQAIVATSAPAFASDFSGFCSPPAPTPAPFSGETTTPFSGETTTPANGLMSLAPPAPDGGTAPVTVEDGPIPHGGRWTSPAQSRTASRGAPGREALVTRHAMQPDVGVGSRATNNKSSALHSTQARLDTRPGSHAGTGDAGREPPLPPAGGPPSWVSALAAAASGAGPSGIAAILLAFALMPPLMLRVRERSVVRRPTDVLAPIDVPV